MRKFISGLLNLLKEARGNALWDLAKWLYRHAAWLVPTVTAVIAGLVGMVRKLPIPALIFIVLAVGLIAYLIIRALATYADRVVTKGRKTESISEPTEKLQIACGPEIEGSVVSAWWTINGKPLPVKFFRVVVNATEESQLVKNCTGFLTRIEKDNKPRWGGNNAQLSFAQGEEPDALAKTIRYPEPEYLDVLVITDRGQIFPGTKSARGIRLWPFHPSMAEIFSGLGDYLLRVTITGDGVVPPKTALLRFNWTEDWETSRLTSIRPESSIQSPEALRSWAVSYEEETAMLEILEDSPKAPVMIMSTKGDRVGNAYAMRLVQVLRTAGMEIGQCVFDESWRLPIGISLWASDAADILQTSKLKAAIKATNLDCENAPRQPPPVSSPIRYDVYLMVKSDRL
jgi:hypothetical protein